MRNFQPPKLPYDKYHKGRLNLKALNSQTFGRIKFGTWGMKLNEACRLTPKHFEAVRRTIARVLKRKGRIWLRKTSPTPVTAKPIRLRMGKGKGKTSYWAYPFTPGSVFCELTGVTSKLSVQALTAAASKLPVKVTICQRYF